MQRGGDAAVEEPVSHSEHRQSVVLTPYIYKEAAGAVHHLLHRFRVGSQWAVAQGRCGQARHASPIPFAQQGAGE